MSTISRKTQPKHQPVNKRQPLRLTDEAALAVHEYQDFVERTTHTRPSINAAINGLIIRGIETTKDGKQS